MVAVSLAGHSEEGKYVWSKTDQSRPRTEINTAMNCHSTGTTFRVRWDSCSFGLVCSSSLASSSSSWKWISKGQVKFVLEQGVGAPALKPQIYYSHFRVLTYSANKVYVRVVFDFPQAFVETFICLSCTKYFFVGFILPHFLSIQACPAKCPYDSQYYKGHI